MRNPNEILDLFKNIENRIDIDKLIYKGKNIWPVFRLKLGFDTLYDRAIPDLRKFPEEPAWSVAYQVPYLLLKISVYFIKFILGLPKIKNKNWFWAFEDVLFVDSVEGKKYCRYIDPYYEFFDEHNLSAQRVTFKTMEAVPCTGKEYFHKSPVFDLQNLQKLYYCIQKLRKYSGGYKKDILLAKKLVGSIAGAVDAREKKYLSLAYYNVFEEVNLYDFCFSVIFRFYKPKNILFECYYSEMKMGLMAAAAKHNINTIDIQHGVVEDFMYIPFTKNPGNQNLLPNYLWCWSNNDVKTMTSYNSPAGKLQPVKLGNLWYKKIQKSNSVVPQEYVDLKSKAGKVILMTLQHQIGYQKIFHELVKEFPDNWICLVRFHPLMDQEDKNEYLQALGNAKNVDFECNKKMNLFQCFQLADVNLTHSSTTAIEALNFNLRSILVDKIGYEYYYKMVDKGVLQFSETPSEIRNMILGNETIDFSKNFEDYLIGIKSETLVDLLNTRVLN